MIAYNNFMKEGKGLPLSSKQFFIRLAVQWLNINDELSRLQADNQMTSTATTRQCWMPRRVLVEECWRLLDGRRFAFVRQASNEVQGQCSSAVESAERLTSFRC